MTADDVALVALLRACAKENNLHGGTRVHADLLKSGLIEKSSYIANNLVAMYAKCGILAKSRELLYGLPICTVVAWTAVIAGYLQQGQGQEALNCFELMQDEGLSPDAVTFGCARKACTTIGALSKGEQIYDEISRQGLLRDNAGLCTALVVMYAKCGALAKAQKVLEEVPARNVLSLNALIAEYVQRGKASDAIKQFEWMKSEKLLPDAVTFVCVLKACGSIRAIRKGGEIHEMVARRGNLGNNVQLGNALVDMYVKCGALGKAQKVLESLPARNVVSWNALMVGYAQQGLSQDVLNCFKQMQGDGHSPDAITFSCILKACGGLGTIGMGEQVHDEITRYGLLRNNVVLGTALVVMYADCGALVKAHTVLMELPARDVVAWNALIAAYAHQGHGEEAITCFEQMHHDKDVSPDAVTFACILKGCGQVGALDKGEQVHDEIAKMGFLEKDTVLGNALVDMYSKCGALTKAQSMLQKLRAQDVVSWNTVLAGYAQQGQYLDALQCFEAIQGKDLCPDKFTYSCVLNACSHTGLVEEGEMCFVNMSSTFGIEPDLEHFMCMIDLYGRAGRLAKAIALTQMIPSSDNSLVWSALLGACRKGGDVNVGRWAFQHALQVDKSDVAAYDLISNIFAAADMQECFGHQSGT